MYSLIHCGALLGTKAQMVHVEVDISSGMPSFTMVGSIGRDVRESKDRVLVALKNVGVSIPPKRITVNLSPADVNKYGTGFDLPIAVGLLRSLELIPIDFETSILFGGELSLDGELKPIKGVLPITLMAKKEGIKEIIVPAQNAKEGALVDGIKVLGARNLLEVISYLKTPKDRRDSILETFVSNPQEILKMNSIEKNDFAFIKGQQNAKRAAEIATAGFHNLLMTGPPGIGKSLVAKAIPGIMPPLSIEESIEVTSIYSVAGNLNEDEPLIVRRPFVNPHHSISLPAMTGGLVIPKPGAVSLAHRGVLFLDEMPEFSQETLDSLRQPLEDGEVFIMRSRGNVSFPSKFMLVGAMNPCPCGFYPDSNKCNCTRPQITRYLNRISGPILDRIDLCVEMEPLSMESLRNEKLNESSEEIRKRVIKARKIQEARFINMPYSFNAEMPAKDIDRFVKLDIKEQRVMEKAFDKLGLTARSYHRVLKTARTIADLDGSEKVLEHHLLESLFFKPDGVYFGGNR